jgi:hypothetical protein
MLPHHRGFRLRVSSEVLQSTSGLRLGKDSLHRGHGPVCHGQLVHNPVHDPLQRLGLDSPPGVADGRQRPPRPVRPMSLGQRAPPETVRYAAERHVAGLPLAGASLTVAQAPPLLPLSMQGRGPWPALPLHQDPTEDCPPRAVPPQRLAGVLGPAGLPTQHDSHGMIDVRHPPLLAKGPLPPLPQAPGCLGGPRELPGHRL